MRRFRLPWLALAATLALAACQTATELDGVTLSAEPAAEVELLAIDGARPWKGWYDWVVIDFVWADDGSDEGKSAFEGRCATPSDYMVRSEGRGHLSHMGRIAYTNDHCVQASDGTHDGVMTFVAADGSSVVTTYTGFGTPDFEAEAYVFVTDFTIVGGTGRFAGATGGGPCHARLAWADEEALVMGQIALRQWIDGIIVYAPGKARGR